MPREIVSHRADDLDILIVDDETFIVTLTKRMLARPGVESVAAAPHGEPPLAMLDAG